ARAPLDVRARQLREQYEERWLGPVARECDGWEFDRGLVVVRLRPGFARGVNLDRVTGRAEGAGGSGVKGGRRARGAGGRLTGSAAAGRLTSVDLSDCDVGASGAAEIAMPGRFGRLSRLNLAYARVGDAGAEALAKGSLGRLAELSL